MSLFKFKRNIVTTIKTNMCQNGKVIALGIHIPTINTTEHVYFKNNAKSYAINISIQKNIVCTIYFADGKINLHSVT